MTSPPMFGPPDGLPDLLSQVDDVESGIGRWHRVEVGGQAVLIRKPQPNALRSFSAAVSRHAKANSNDMVTLFVQEHTHPESWEALLVRMLDPEDPIGLDTLGAVMREIATLGTARPTVPSPALR